MAATITVPKGDYGFVLSFTVQNSAGAAYNLTGYTVTLKAWWPGTPGTLIVNGACSITVAANGTCSYTVASGDFTATGVLNAELELTKASTIESTETFNIQVVESP